MIRLFFRYAPVGVMGTLAIFHNSIVFAILAAAMLISEAIKEASND